MPRENTSVAGRHYYIVDESSMISDVPVKDATQAVFGSGRLLNDLLSYDPSGKFIFVGDICQLPPVTQPFSPALAKEYFQTEYGITAYESTLTQIVRQNKDNDIVLSEMTVSGHHATLNIRRMKTTKEYLADIYVRGVNGGFVNEEEVRKEAECKNGDFLTIGDNYVLYLILVNPFELGLKVAEGFAPAEEAAPVKEEKRDEFDLDSDRTSASGRLYDSSRRPVGGTEGMDGVADIENGYTSHLL